MEESCKSNKITNNKWKNNLIFWADENLIWAVKSYWGGDGINLYGN